MPITSRWEYRLNRFEKALQQLRAAVDAAHERDLSDLEKQGLIKAFEFTYEMAWMTLKDYLLFQGDAEIGGARDTIREAFSMGLIHDGEGWMDMLKSRNETVHTYNEEVSEGVTEKVIQKYFALFEALATQMNTKKPA